tara:strand:- start:341 stop:844 length:504 start_codon:yes stop_codon:yes gene_type:complete
LSNNINKLDIVKNWFNSIDAKKGIGEELFLSISQLTPIINVDILIKNNKNEILLTWRSDQYYGPGWHVPGGIVRFKETLLDRVKKVAKSELLLELNNINGPIGHHEMFNNTRNIRGHFISFVFEVVLIKQPPIKLKSGTTPKEGEWKWFKKCPEDFIHNQNALRVYF